MQGLQHRGVDMKSMTHTMKVNDEIQIMKISRPKASPSQYYYATVRDPSIIKITESTKVSLVLNKEEHLYTIRALRSGWTTITFELKHMIDGQVLENDTQIFVVT
jgi:hypothetical protein